VKVAKDNDVGFDTILLFIVAFSNMAGEKKVNDDNCSFDLLFVVIHF